MAAYMVQQFSVATQLVLCSVLVLATLWIIKKICLRGNMQYPPGPRGLPILGHLHMLESLPHRTLTHLSKIYGPLISLQFGSLPTIVASSPEMAKLILHTHDKTLSGRPMNFIAPNNIVGGFLGITFSSTGPYWKLLRQLCFTEFFSAKHLNYSKPLRVQEVHKLMVSIYDAEGMPFSIRENLYKTNMNIISRMVLSKSLEEITMEMPNSEKNMMDTLLDLFNFTGLFNIGDFIPWLAWLDVQGYKKRIKERACFVNYVFQELIDKRRRGHSNNQSGPVDFLDVLLLASQDAKNTQLQIKDGNIIAVILEMFIAGSDTTAVTTEWALTELLKNPKKLKTLQEEIYKIVGCSRLIQEADLPNLPYLRAVVNETMRLHPTLPLLAPHRSMEESQICGYQIPKNTLVYVNASAIHEDQNIWENPLEFSPERFLGGNIDALTQQCKFLPFSTGRRMCPGIALALLSVQSVLGNLVHAFDWRTVPRRNFKEKVGLVLALEEPLVIVPLPKLPKCVLETLA